MIDGKMDKVERKALKQKNKTSKIGKKSKSLYNQKTFVNKHRPYRGFGT